MPNFEPRPDTGSLFVNDRKTTENHPDRTGTAEIQCPHCTALASFRVSGWLKTSKAGIKFMSLSFRPKEARPARNGDLNFNQSDDPDW